MIDKKIRFEIKGNYPGSEWLEISRESAERKLSEYYKLQNFEAIVDFLAANESGKGIKLTPFEYIRILKLSF